MDQKPEDSTNLKMAAGEAPDEEGQIRIFNREKRRYRVRRSVLWVGLTVLSVSIALLALATYMKDYTDRRVAQSYDQLLRDAGSFSEFERGVYSRESFRRVYFAFAPNLVGVAASREAFALGDYDFLTTGLLYDKNGNILAPAEILKGRSSAFVRRVANDQDSISEAKILGVDEASGLALISVPALARAEGAKPMDDTLAHGQTLLHMAMPEGSAQKGNITLSGLHSPVSLHTLNTEKGQIKLSVFSLATLANTLNDGGAVLNLDGELAGMASLKLSKALKFYPYTAVISVTELTKIADRIQSGEVPGSLSLGLSGRMIQYDAIAGPGFYVLEVTAGSSSDRGGIRPTDIILAINGEAMAENRTIDSYLIGHRAGETLAVEIIQGTERKTLNILIY